jgi:hypothetical protein
VYKHTITVTLDDDVVHRYSIMEWETLLLRTSAIHQDELPLSYGRIAEVLAVEYRRYGMAYFCHEYGAATHNTNGSLVKEATETTYTDDKGFSIGTRVKPNNLPPLPEPNTLQIGIANCRTK